MLNENQYSSSEKYEARIYLSRKLKQILCQNMNGMYDGLTILPEEYKNDFKVYLENILEKDKSITAAKDEGIFICKKVYKFQGKGPCFIVSCIIAHSPLQGF